MKLISFQKLGENRQTPRLWLESRRLVRLGFAAGTAFSIEQRAYGIRLRYHKINTGPFVETPHGLRLLHKEEVERLMGCEIACAHYATAIEILGQGVQTRVFREVLRQLAVFLSR